MSRKYKFLNPEGIYFVSFATVYWLDVFVRDRYFNVLIESFRYCQEHLGMRIHAFCLMPSHVHLIFSATNYNPGDLIKSFKTFTSKKMQSMILEDPQESRKEFLMWMMKRAGTKNSNVQNRQFWQQHNKPIELWSNHVIDQKVTYVHENPVEAGFVLEAEYWKYSSAVDYSGGKGLLEIEFLD
ncbi:MAG: transposase [Cyclobacteriaceae bacterium]